jgi:hypothetical protein
MSSTTGKNPEVEASCYAITDCGKGTKRVSLPLPLPCITILVHGVNDVGEAYDAQESGLCKGLNARLDRAHKLAMNAWGDLVASSYRMPPAKPSEGIQADPDAVYFRRTPDRRTWSPVVPFYWGMREEERHIKKDNWHGQWTDRHGNRLDKNGAKNGGPFANATSTLNAMWGNGFSGKIGGSETFADAASSPLHNLKKAAPRHYMLLAAQRLAMLIKMIRNKKGYEHVAINLLCHSQGSMVALTAHALLAQEGHKCAADTLILQDSPYSLEETVLEHHDGVTGGDQQTTVSRIRTLSNIVRYVDDHKSATPMLQDLEFGNKKGKAVAGPNWKPGAGSRHWAMGEVHTFTERDNRGKVYLYFSQDDGTVALMSVQGIGWQGVPDTVRTLGRRYRTPGLLVGKVDAVDTFDFINVSALPALGTGFRQRVFTARQVNGQPVMVGLPPARYEMRSSGGIWPLTEENSTTGNWSASVKQIERGAVRYVNGEELHPKVTPILNSGEAGHRGKLGVSPIDAAIAISAKGAIATRSYMFQEFRTGKRRHASPLTPEEIGIVEDNLPGQRQGAHLAPDDRLRVVGEPWINGDRIEFMYSTETANEARARWQNHATDDNSYHSAIPANPAHAAGVTAYDVSLGQPLPISEDDKAYLAYLCAVADWRTDWSRFQRKKNSPVAMKIYRFLNDEKTAGAKNLILATSFYYQQGTLPSAIAEEGVVKLSRPALIASHTVTDRQSGKYLD